MARGTKPPERTVERDEEHMDRATRSARDRALREHIHNLNRHARALYDTYDLHEVELRITRMEEEIAAAKTLLAKR